jgi:hypothetical protein
MRGEHLPDNIIDMMGGAIDEVFLYDDYDMKLKLDLSDRYRVLYCKLKGDKKVKLKKVVDYKSLKYLTPLEIGQIVKELALDQLHIITKEIVTDSTKDYFLIRNSILFIDSARGKVVEKGLILKYLSGFVNSEKEDLRVLSESCISKLGMRPNREEGEREMGRKGNCILKRPGEMPAGTECERLKIEPNNNDELPEEGEIVEPGGEENVDLPVPPNFRQQEEGCGKRCDSSPPKAKKKDLVKQSYEEEGGYKEVEAGSGADRRLDTRVSDISEKEPLDISKKVLRDRYRYEYRGGYDRRYRDDARGYYYDDYYDRGGETGRRDYNRYEYYDSYDRTPSYDYDGKRRKYYD